MNPYQVLQVSNEAEPEIIVAAYRSLARKYHPDRYIGADANARMAELNAAFEMLSDPERRATWDHADALQHVWQAPAPPPVRSTGAPYATTPGGFRVEFSTSQALLHKALKASVLAAVILARRSRRRR